MPKFFVPAAKDDDEAEGVRTAIIKFMVDQGFRDITSKRIFKLAYRHNSQDYEAEVGQPDTLAGGPVVLMILEARFGELYLVCTPSRGGAGGNPILVGRPSVRSIEEFE